jgi:AcrR family transcriptional regulator
MHERGTPREPLSRHRVLAAAVALADAEGVKALTMRRLAAELGVEAMSLYHHLPGKDGLLEGLADTIIGEIDTAVAAVGEDGLCQGWRLRIKRRFLAARSVMLRHPWAPGVLGSRPTIPASLYTYYDAILATLVEGGFSYHLAHRALHAFGSLALGFAQEVFSPASAGGGLDSAPAEADLAAMAQTVPHLAAMVASEVHDATDPALGWCDTQTEFEFTLDLLLDGLERARDAPTPSPPTAP